MMFTYQDFLKFCTNFVVQNGHEFEERSVQQLNDNPHEYYYDCTYRDNHNFKSKVRISLKNGHILWDVAEGWDDAYVELQNILNDLILSEQPLEVSKKRAYGVFNKLSENIKRAEIGEISFDEVFHNIPIRDCLAKHMIIATTWHIEDIRSLFPNSLSDDELFEKLEDMQDGITDDAVASGWDAINYLIPAESEVE